VPHGENGCKKRQVLGLTPTRGKSRLPRSHENDAERAVRGPCSRVEAIPRLQVPGAEPLVCQVGITSGLVVVDKQVDRRRSMARRYTYPSACTR
jgi:hypothetical protein